jgi:hypothetical protein
MSDRTADWYRTTKCPFVVQLNEFQSIWNPQLKDGFPSCLTWGITTFDHKHRQRRLVTCVTEASDNSYRLSIRIAVTIAFGWGNWSRQFRFDHATRVVKCPKRAAQRGFTATATLRSHRASIAGESCDTSHGALRSMQRSTTLTRSCSIREN